MKLLKIPKFVPLILLIVTPFFIADMGPKPSASFEIIYKTESHSELIGYALYLCDTADCSNPQSTEDIFFVFDCDQDGCTSWGYDYPEFMYITFEFASGTTLTSNIFTKMHFDAKYEITIGPDQLEVNETGGSNFGKLGGPLGWVIYGSIAGAVCGGVSIVIVIVLVIVLIVRKLRKKPSEAE